MKKILSFITSIACFLASIVCVTHATPTITYIGSTTLNPNSKIMNYTDPTLALIQSSGSRETSQIIYEYSHAAITQNSNARYVINTSFSNRDVSIRIARFVREANDGFAFREEFNSHPPRSQSAPRSYTAETGCTDMDSDIHTDSDILSSRSFSSFSFPELDLEEK